MPELPEVETVKRGLEPLLQNRTIVDVQVSGKPLRYPLPDGLRDILVGQPVIRMTRRSKYIWWEMPRINLLVHLGMSGCFMVDSPTHSHDHWVLFLDNGMRIAYRDPRRFGFLLAFDSNIIPPVLERLGVDAWPNPPDPDNLWQILKNRTIPIKQALLDQCILAGIGNIYASEALFLAGIHPSTPAQTLDKERIKRLCEAVHHTLDRAVAVGGSTLQDHRQINGEYGCFQHEFKVYDRAGEDCITCQHPIRSMKQGGRSTYYCEVCQPLKCL
jgi:formamidopyrimidine-DNA glycosylase